MLLVTAHKAQQVVLQDMVIQVASHIQVVIRHTQAVAVEALEVRGDLQFLVQVAMEVLE